MFGVLIENSKGQSGNSIHHWAVTIGREVTCVLYADVKLCFGVTHDFCTLFIYLNKVDIAGNFLNIFIYFKISMKLQLSVSPAACP